MTFAKNGSYVEEYTAGHLGTKFVEYIVIYEAMIAKKWPTFGCKIEQMTQLWWNSKSTWPPTYWM